MWSNVPSHKLVCFKNTLALSFTVDLFAVNRMADNYGKPMATSWEDNMNISYLDCYGLVGLSS